MNRGREEARRFTTDQRTDRGGGGTVVQVARALLTVGAIVIYGAPLAAQSAPFAGGPAEVRVIVPGSASPGTQLTVDVNVDLTGMTGVCGANSAVPAVLGGYVIPIAFSSADLAFVSASACTSPQFSTPPAATDPITANAAGEVTIAASQTSQTAPTGNVCVARLTFLVQPNASASFITPAAPDLSSAFQNCAGGGTGGPAPIPAIGVPTSAGVQPIPALSGGALALLAGLLSIAAVMSLRTLRG
jgi:hypothetical protein